MALDPNLGQFRSLGSGGRSRCTFLNRGISTPFENALALCGEMYNVGALHLVVPKAHYNAVGAPYLTAMNEEMKVASAHDAIIQE